MTKPGDRHRQPDVVRQGRHMNSGLLAWMVRVREMVRITGMSSWEWGIRRFRTRMVWVFRRSCHSCMNVIWRRPKLFLLVSFLVMISLTGCEHCRKTGPGSCSLIKELLSEIAHVVDQIEHPSL